MKLTCLSKGCGFYFPPSYMVNVCGVRILLDCPVDFSALTIFSPVPAEETSDWLVHNCLGSDSDVWKRQKIEKPLDAKNLIYAEPWYKTVKNLHLWNVSLIDIVLISSPMGMLGLPFLTRMKEFSAKIYVTEATARFGQLIMKDLISMHMEFKQFYGPEDSGFPLWMQWEELELLPSSLRGIAFGKRGEELGGWVSLYSAIDVKNCMTKVQLLKYGEEACYNGTLILKAFSSGLEIGACNWTINGPKRKIACISSSVFISAHAMNFNYHALQGFDLILYSDLSSVDTKESIDFKSSAEEKIDDNSCPEEPIESLLDKNEHLEESEKLAFVCSCAVDSVKAGGSVLIPINRFGNCLLLLEQISTFLESSALKIPVYVISSVGEELLALSNVIPEWLCEQRQEKLYSGEPLFGHVELLKDRKIHVFPAVHSPKLLTIWQEPCIVFSPHYSLRLGPAVHLLRRWYGDKNSLLILESEVDADLALLPFKPMAMKVLQCSFLSGIKLQKVHPLLQTLQPKLVLFPENLRSHVNFSNANSFSVMYYIENETIRVPRLEESSELEITTDLATKSQWRKLKYGNMNITRLSGELCVDRGKYLLSCSKNPTESSQSRKPLLHWGSPDMEMLMNALSQMGINATVEQGMSDSESQINGLIHIHDPSKALIEVSATSTLISAADENLASCIFEAVSSVLDGV